MNIYKIEDFKIWQKARIYCCEIYKVAANLNIQEKYNIGRHMRANARNVPANIAEGFYRYHYKDSVRFYLIARGSLGEIRSDLYLCLDNNYLGEKVFNELIIGNDEILIMLNSFIKYIKNTNNAIT